jgi:glutamate 5-kinase
VKHIPVVIEMSSAIQKLAVDKKNNISVGGMSSKLKAAEMVTRSGIFYLIGDGYHHGLLDVLRNETCATIFLPSKHKMSSRHRWLAFSGSTQGILTVDDGAQKALREKGKSLLPAGIKNITGSFKAGDNVEIKAMNGAAIGRGLVNYSSEEIRRIMGCKTSAIAAILGGKEFDEVIHRDNLVVF